MADQKISELTQVTNLETADEFAVVDGSITKKVTYGDLVTDLEATMDVESSSQLDARDTANRTRSNHTGTQLSSTISDFDTEVSNNTDVSANTAARHTHSNKAILDATSASFTTADETKLDGIETGATADQSDSEIVTAINNELGNTDWQTQVPALTQEQVEDYVAGLFQAGSHTNITVTYDDVAGSISLSGSAGGGGGGGSTLTQEEVEDFVGGLVAGGTGITATYNDAGNELSISLSGESFTTALKTKLNGIATSATANDTDANLKNRANHTGTQPISTVTNLQTTLDGKATSAQGALADTALQAETDTLQTVTDRGATTTTNITVPDVTYDTANGEVSIIGNFGASQDIDWQTATHFTGTLDANCTITHSAETSGQSITLYLTGDGTQRTITWSDVDTWLDGTDGTAPVAPTTTGETLVVTLQFIGTSCYASATGNYSLI